MIEIIQNNKNETLVDKMSRQIVEEKQNRIDDKEEEAIIEDLRAPRNFRQIGTPGEHEKIYMEDYVYTYLHPVSDYAEELRVCILVGHIEKKKNAYYVFVQGAFELRDIEYSLEVPIFTETTRSKICALVKQYFEGMILLGWYLDRKGRAPTLTPELERIHKNFFGGRDKILFLSNSLEKEEGLFVYEDNATRKQNGYYIYYERNPQMQEYMISSREEEDAPIEPEEVLDEALNSYREMVIRKEIHTPRRWNIVLYATSFLLVLTICIVGVTMLNNYNQMKDIKSAVTFLAGDNMNQVGNTENEETEKQAIIETINGNVTKQETETTVVEQSTAEQNTPEQNTAEQNTAEQNTAEQNTAEQNTSDAPASTDTTEAVESSALTEAETIQLQGYYIVQKGENLLNICQKIYGTTEMMSQICEKNGIEDLDKIYAGEKLILP